MARTPLALGDPELFMQGLDRFVPGLWLTFVIRIDPIPLWVVGYWLLFTGVRRMERALKNEDGGDVMGVSWMYPFAALGTVATTVLLLTDALAPFTIAMLFYATLCVLLAPTIISIGCLWRVCEGLLEGDGAYRWRVLYTIAWGGIAILVGHAHFNWFLYGSVWGVYTILDRDYSSPLLTAFEIGLVFAGLVLTVRMVWALWTAPRLTRHAIGSMHRDADSVG